jgi:hypothetical protein
MRQQDQDQGEDVMKKTILDTLIRDASLFLSAQNGFEEGMAAYKRGDYATALKKWRPLAEAGDAEAQNNLGLMYADDRGVPQDDEEAVKWLRLAAEQGDAVAQNNLGAMYAKGRGVPQDKVLAYALFNLSAAGDPPFNKAISNRKAIVEQMSPREIEAARALTRGLAQPGNFGKALDAYLKRAQAAKPKD